jgi:ribonuclease-3
MRIIKKIFSKSRSLEDGIFFGAIEKILGFAPKNIDFYKKAFTHRSSNILDEVGNPLNYERL